MTGCSGAVTGYGLSEPRGAHAEFAALVPPSGDDFVRFQRVEDAGPRIHLDLACAEREAETRRHLRLGAIRVEDRDHWTVLTDPVGSPYCITDRPSDPLASRS